MLLQVRLELLIRRRPEGRTGKGLLGQPLQAQMYDRIGLVHPQLERALKGSIVGKRLVHEAHVLDQPNADRWIRLRPVSPRTKVRQNAIVDGPLDLDRRRASGDGHHQGAPQRTDRQLHRMQDTAHTDQEHPDDEKAHQRSPGQDSR